MTTSSTTTQLFTSIQFMVTTYLPSCLASMVKECVQFRRNDYWDSLHLASRWTPFHKRLQCMSPALKQSLAMFLETFAPCMDICNVMSPETVTLHSSTIKHWQERQDCGTWEAAIGDDEEGNRRYLRLTFKNDDQTGYMCMWRVTCFRP